MTLPVPPSVWDALREFLEEGKTGQVVFDVHEGRVMGCRVTQSIRVNERAAMPPLEYKSTR